MTTAVTFVDDQPRALGKNISAYDNEIITFACTFWDTPTSPSALCYVNRQDKTSTLMPSGSHSASGLVVTLKPLNIAALSGVGGKRIVVAVTATVGGETRTKEIVVIVRKKELE